MSTAQATNGLRGIGLVERDLPTSLPVSDADYTSLVDAIEAKIFNPGGHREKFISVTPLALMDRLSDRSAWPPGEAAKVKRFFMYLANWRQQGYGANLLELARTYEPFSPDSDLLITRTYTQPEKKVLERELVNGVRRLMQQANYTRIDPSQIDILLTKESHYGLDLHVDLKAFDELEIYYRGAVVTRTVRRSKRRLYLRKEEFDLPVFQRLAILFKLKPFDKRVIEIMADERIDRVTAERRLRKRRGPIADQISSDFIYIKLFKNIPRNDLEMVFPNTRIRFRLFDKIKLGVTAGGGLGMGVAGTVSKLAVATNPVALAGALAGLGGIAFRQIVNFANQRNKYLVTMAQNLYSHALADNGGVMTLLAARAAEEDVKEEVLLYSLLAKECVHISELQDADKAIERYLTSTFGLDTDFDVEDALGRLLQDGIVRQMPDGRLLALSPADAAARIDELWDSYLDRLTDIASQEGVEYEGEAPAALS
ncbi:MAG: DUF3754 domain-containing protein [Hyphomicrobiaceae bacterium]